MATDVARLSFDPARRYAGVVTQQGRVALEAEQNEQRTIDAEERREVLLDVVGPAGTPDDGYAVGPASGTDLTIGAGTMYVGGLRVVLDEAITTDKQPEWLDQPVVDVDRAGREHVLLLVTERDVTAVEDPALYEVALGGPDGAARTRLVQHIVRRPTDASTCAGALGIDLKGWAAEGLSFDPATMQLASGTRLLVTWQQDPDVGDPCEPSSTGGYLGAENQCIRFQITGIDPDDGTITAVWGYDDASALYRVTPDDSAAPVLTLDRSPVDDHHRPRAGQPVQVLRASAELTSTDGQVEGWVAALGGVVGVLATPYDPDTKTVAFPTALPSDYDDDPQLYLRVWQEQLTGVTLGTPVALTGTGMQVTLSLATGGVPHVDDFWCVAVRPSTPTTVYPARYLRTPQPPDGPRQWVCPLAVIGWQDGVFDLLEDCRHPFDPLTELDDDGCCTLEVRPSDAPRLQALLDAAVAGRSIKERGDRVTLCFSPGRYELVRPLVLRERHSNVTLRGCSGAAVLAVRPEAVKDFGQGMVLLIEADNVSITGFELELPQVPAVAGRVTGLANTGFTAAVSDAVNSQVGNLWVSIGIRPVSCAVLEVADCLFRFTVGEHETTPEVAQTMPRHVFGVGVFAAGAQWGLRLTGNRFLHDPLAPIVGDGARRVLAGYLLGDTALTRDNRERATRALGAARLPALLDDAIITDNRFVGIAAPLLVSARLGQVTIARNQVERCYGGFWLVDSEALASTDLTGKYEVAGGREPAAALARAAVGGGLLDPVLVLLAMFAAVHPLPDLEDRRPRGLVQWESAHTKARLTEATGLRTRGMSSLVSALLRDHPTTDPADGTAAPTTTRARSRATATSALFNTPITTVDAPAVTVPTSPTIMLEANLVPVLIGWIATLALIDEEREGIRTTLSVDANIVECAVPDKGTTGPALFVYTRATERGQGEVSPSTAAVSVACRLVSRLELTVAASASALLLTSP